MDTRTLQRPGQRNSRQSVQANSINKLGKSTNTNIH